MKKLLLSAILLVASIYTMEKPHFYTTTSEEGKKQAELINAIDKGDKAKIDLLLKSGTDINKPFGLLGYWPHTPLTLILFGEFSRVHRAPAGNREDTARFLISRGADTAQLTPFLENEAESGDVEKVRFLLSFGAKDINGFALKEATEHYNHYSTEKYDADATNRYGQIIKLLEQAKKGGPVKLTPVAKPAPAIKPVRLVPVTRPAAAKPAVTEELSFSEKLLLEGLKTGK